MFEGKVFVPPRMRPPLALDVEGPNPRGHGSGGGARRRRDMQGFAIVEGLAEDADEQDDVVDGADNGAVDDDMFAGDVLEDALAEVLEEYYGSELDPPPPVPPPPSPPEELPGPAEVALAPAPPPPPEGHDPEDHQPRRRQGVGEPWGANGLFQLIVKRSGKSQGWQATCPFHRGTPTAPKCRKFHPASSSSEVDMQRAKATAKAWCLAALQFDRKYKHLDDWSRDGACLDETVLDLQSFLMRWPDSQPVPDYILDGLSFPP